MVLRARAPVRIDFAGGWTDVALFTEEQSGAVVNATINLCSYVTVRSIPYKEIETKEYGYKHLKTIENRAVRIYSADFNLYHEAAKIKLLEYDGTVDLIKAALKKSSIDYGLEIITRSNAPAGSGLGTSASMGVTLIGVLSRLSGIGLLPYEVAEQASSIERDELGMLGGKQDHYASAIGGINFMEFAGEEVKTSELRLSSDIQYELEKSLVLCYTGKSRLSSNVHQNVLDSYIAKNKITLSALRNLKQIAVEMKSALLTGDLSSFARLLNENWQNQKELHPSVTNAQIDSLFELALRNGAAGGKACGAGGGGCLVFYCEPDKEHLVRRRLEEAGIEIINFSFEFDGLQIWHSLEEFKNED